MTAVLARRWARCLAASWTTRALAALAAVFAATGPALARHLPDLLARALGDAGGVSVTFLAEPTLADAWAQWTSNLTQLLGLLVPVVAAATLAADLDRGTAATTLTRPVPRAGYLLTAFGAAFAAVAAIIAAGTALTVAAAIPFFDDPLAGAGGLAAAVAAWLAFAASVIAVTLLAAAAGAGALAAAAAGIGYVAAMAVASLWPAIAEWSPAGLLRATAELAAAADPGPPLAGPVAAGAAVTLAALAAAVHLLNHRDLRSH